MGILANLRARRNFGSIQETVFFIVKPIQEYAFIGTSNINEAMTIFSILLAQRAQGATFAGQTKENLLLENGIDIVYLNYEECFGRNNNFYELDLPLFVFAAMYLESVNIRQGMKDADLILKKEVFDTIYDTCEHLCILQVKFTRKESFENMVKFSTYLSRKYRV
jgi:hypothetical protein